MELKTNYQYTYFIHPFVVKEGKYQKYILKMLKDKNCRLKIFQKEKDLRLYKYFLPKTRDFLFSSFSFTNGKMKKFEELPIETRSAILNKYPCTIFEYSLKKDIQAKVDGKKGIFFSIQKVEIICFNTGICFLCMKTSVEDNFEFSNILNFNYKFRDINQEVSNLNNYDNIRLQNDTFSTTETLRDFIRNITGSKVEALKLDIDTERFITYAYTCIDQENWNSNRHFENIKYNFIKYSNILSADSSREISDNEITVFSAWKYAKIGITKLGMLLFSSSADINNYTILPDEYENQFLYTYILNLYKKIYLKKIQNELKNINKVKKARKKFIEFTKNLWIQEITEDEIGTELNHKIQKVLEIDKLYNEVKSKYDTLYKELNIERNMKSTIIIAIVLVASLVFNILNFIVMTK